MSEEIRQQFVEFLQEHHEFFCLDDQDHDLIQLEINIGEVVTTKAGGPENAIHSEARSVQPIEEDAQTR